MKRTIIFYASAVILTLLLTVFWGSCADRSKGELNKLLLDVADADGDISSGDWQELSAFFETNRAHYPEFYDGDELNVEYVKNYVTEFFADRRPPKEITFSGVVGKQVVVDFYLERSGSMTGYDNADVDGAFKAAIVGMMNKVPDNVSRLFIVNGTVNEYPEGTSKFLQDNDIFEATKGIGDPSYTDFREIFDILLNKTGNNSLSVLFSDMIYSTRDMQGINPQKVFSEAKGMTNAVFKEPSANRSMLVVKLNGMFSGQYYSYNNAVSRYRGNRPFYVVMVADNSVMSRLANDKELGALAKVETLPGYENMYLFASPDIFKPHYTLLLSHPSIRGRFRTVRGQQEAITNIDDVEIDRNSGDIQLVLAADLSGVLADSRSLLNPANYKVSADDEVVIQQITPIDEHKDLTAAEKKYAGNATHLFILRMKSFTNDQEISISLRNVLPEWVSQTSIDDDTTPDAHSTFAFGYLMQGIYDAYTRNVKGEPAYFTMTLKLEK